MKIHFLLDEQVHLQPCPTYVSAMAFLADGGFTVTRGIPEAALLCPERLCVRHDLYVLESRSELALSVAAVLHDRGGQLLNPYPGCALAQNRITAASRLGAAGVPIPRSWVTADFAMLCELATDRAVIVKPYRSCASVKNVVAHGPDDLVGIPLREQPVLVQELVERRGPDVQLQVIGQQVFALERGTAASIPAGAELREIALRCGRVFGLGVFAIEVVQGRDGPVVVDFDRAPCLSAVPHGASLLARHIESVVAGRTPLQRQPPLLQLPPGPATLMQGAAAWNDGCGAGWRQA